MFRPTILLTAAALAAALDVEPAKLATADAAPLDPGAVELALGAVRSTADLAYDADGAREDRDGTTIGVDIGVGVTVGLVEDLDAGISVGWSRLRDAAADPDHGNGPTDAELGVKWRFWSVDADDQAWAFALLPSATVPLGRGQDAEAEIPTATRFWTTGLMLAGSGSIGRLALNADAGWSRAFGSEDDCEGYRGSVVADVALGLQVADGVQPEIDLSWARDQVDEGPAPWSLTVTAGAQFGLPCGRLGLGVQRVIDGSGCDCATGVVADLALALR